GCGNTMNDGSITVYGHAGDTIGLAMRGGKIYVRDDVGYRAGIHMKEYGDKIPLLVIGGSAQDFLGEYMAGGTIVLLGLNLKQPGKHTSCFMGTGMHAGTIYLRGDIEDYQLGKEVGVTEPTPEEQIIIQGFIDEYQAKFGTIKEAISPTQFTKVFPRFARPYGRLYVPG
ncbi:hypothetical protein ACFLWF_00235, partial [Chloroflexota bacterium]